MLEHPAVVVARAKQNSAIARRRMRNIMALKGMFYWNREAILIRSSHCIDNLVNFLATGSSAYVVCQCQISKICEKCAVRLSFEWSVIKNVIHFTEMGDRAV
jgi:hypothetical protein